MKPSLSIISCACGRLDSFAFHLRCLADQPGAKDAEYCVGLWGDPAEHIEILDRYADRFKAIKHPDEPDYMEGLERGRDCRAGESAAFTVRHNLSPPNILRAQTPGPTPGREGT